MYTSEGTKMRSIENQLAEQQKQSWLMLVAGITLGFIGLHFVVARPMAREIERMAHPSDASFSGIMTNFAPCVSLF